MPPGVHNSQQPYCFGNFILQRIILKHSHIATIPRNTPHNVVNSWQADKDFAAAPPKFTASRLAPLHPDAPIITASYEV